MSYTNHTTNLELPQYVGTDKPTYLGDFNTAMSIIDSAYASNKALAEGAQTTANSASTTANSAQTTANSAESTANSASTIASQADVKADTALTSATSAGTTATSALTKASANENKIGDLSSLNTNVKTDLVSAINEVNSGYTKLTATGTTPITLPASYETIIVKVKASRSYNWNLGTFTKTYIDSIATNDHETFRAGHYTSSNDNSYCDVQISNTEVVLTGTGHTGSDTTSSSTIEVYYK